MSVVAGCAGEGGLARKMQESCFRSRSAATVARKRIAKEKPSSRRKEPVDAERAEIRRVTITSMQLDAVRHPASQVLLETMECNDHSPFPGKGKLGIASEMRCPRAAGDLMYWCLAYAGAHAHTPNVGRVVLESPSFSAAIRLGLLRVIPLTEQ